MRVTWNATMVVTISKAEAMGHSLTPFGSIEGKRFGIAVRRAKCKRCGLPFLIVRQEHGLLMVDEKTLATQGDSARKFSRQLAA
jgi:hypothetical protein